MADELPVHEILCDAMEYLVKLGSNLRTRSENLKEKRISKSKLTNAHAVQKAANKVLLICELSKKSLDNVESGIKRILEVIGDSQSSKRDGGNNINQPASFSSKNKYNYIEVGKLSLKINKRIPLKHYQSVRVNAKRMTLSMIEKYPVYHDCKLFRLRVKSKKDTLSPQKDSDDNLPLKERVHSSDSEVKSKDESHKEKKLNKEKPRNSFESSENVKESEDYQLKSNMKKNFKISSDSETDQNKSKESETCIEKISNDEKDVLNDSLSSDTKYKPNNVTEKNCNTISNSDNGDSIHLNTCKKKKRVIQDTSKSENEVGEKNNEGELSKGQDSDKRISVKPKTNSTSRRFSTPSKSKEMEIDSQITTKPRSSSESKVLEKDVKGNFECNKIERKLTKNYETDHRSIRNKNAVNLSECNDVVTIDLDDCNNGHISPLEEGFRGFDTKTLSECSQTQNDGKPVTPNVDDSNDDSLDSKKEKPSIKCVNLSKLLKPIILQNIGKKLSEKTTKLVDKKNSLNKNNLKEEREKQESEEYWKIKRKEVSNFKPKNFSIKVTRLTTYTDTFLKTHYIKKITSMGTLLKDIDSGNVKDISLSHLNNVKKILLHDSESDQNTSDKENPVKKSGETSKNSVASEECGRELKINTEKTPDSLKAVESENNKNIEMTPRKAKSVLLDDSSLENTPKTPKQNEKEDTDVGTPQSKRKKIMESMHAKKMLLTYSSSDTEDEQLNIALKEIKDSLLRGNSSDENGSKDESKRTSDSSVSSVKKMGRTKAKPTSSSNQNSDTQDTSDKEIEGLTNVKTLNKTHRRCDSPTDSQGSSNKTRDRSRKMPTAPPIEKDALETYTSSNPSENEDDVEEDLPQISIAGLNGDGEDHLAKDDLLDDSDSSHTPNEKEKGPEQTKKQGESEEENLKSKRRKANAISSDSEIGSSRKKCDMSDFEDSEGSMEPKKKNKKSKRKKSSESEESDGNSSNEGGKKKRRRIKQVDSEGSGSDTENEGRNKHGRKNIRKVMGKDQLEEATKKAARQEKERIARIAERQKVYNNLQFDESGKPDEVVLEKVVLDFDPDTKEPLIQVDRGLVKKLKPHQANGIKFMWDACFESVKRIKKDKGSGCILAHCMGLGKTLQVISLTHTLLVHSDLTRVNRVLVVCPLSTVLNWVNEFKIWLKHAVSDYEIDVYELSRYKQNSERAYQMSQWFTGGGVCVLGYEMFRNLSADNSKKFRKKMLKSFQESLVDPGPDLVVCDEGHLLKNEKTSLSQSMNRVKTLRRIVLTGTPLQNNLKEYYCMVQFVKPNLLGKYNEYLNRFVNPITNGQYTDSTEYDIKVMKRRSHVLHKMLDGAVQRRDYGVLAPFLPPKHEYVLFITLTDVQVKLYQYYLDNYSRRPMPGKSSGFLFPDFQSLQRIWTHPLVLKYNSERYEIMQQKKREREEEEDSEGSLADFIDDDSSPEETSTEESSDDMSDVSDDSRKKSKKKKASKKGKGKDSKASTRRGTRANPVALEEEDKNNSDVEEVKNDNPTEWWIKLVSDDELDDLKNSHKLLLLFDILRQCEAIGDKLLVFSQSLYSLDLIEHFLGKVDEATQEGRIDDKLAGHVGSWSPGIDYFRLDGSTSCENRSIWCKNFNREDNPRARLFLISTRAGGLGINLVAANRVVIFDVSWNPSHDVQSIFRVYRFGQKKPCYVYRFLAMGTMEEKIYERQVTKQAISKRVIDEQQIDRHYAENDLAELYTFQPTPPSPRAIPALPKDRLFAEMLKDHEAQIYKYHEHDSLLENKEEETLSEEERKAAWEDFENEKNRPPPAPFVSPWNMHNGMAPGLLAAQQQQLAYAALAAMLRKDMPNINEQQIRDMLPIICNSNPAMFGGYDYGLMQKMNDIYKYSQPGMMNPSMMNPMNATGSMGGTSGLQYSPPWQRQQQQQQQMRLQQMLQQQNPMGAKYYAGGLGSRDPVAMALQQQRAREIMLGERARPRGRPPAARPPPTLPTHASDVVNLDSD